MTNGYTQTKYLIVLCHGMAGFDSLFGVVDYFHGIAETLEDGGADVHVTHVPAFGSSEQRGEALLAQVEDIVAQTGKGKVNLVGHSHGGFDVRYVAAVRPISWPPSPQSAPRTRARSWRNLLRDNIQEGGYAEGVVSLFANSLGVLEGILSGNLSEQDSVAAMESLTAAGAGEFDAIPSGCQRRRVGRAPSRPAGISIIRGAAPRRSPTCSNVSDVALGLSSLVYEEDNDGLVGKCSSHFGKVIRDDYRMNHLDEVNLLSRVRVGVLTNPKTVFRTHTNRLKNAGL